MSQRIVIDPNDPITHPDCSHEFPLGQGISQHLIERYKEKFDQKLPEEREALEARAVRTTKRQLSGRFEEQVDELTMTKLEAPQGNVCSGQFTQKARTVLDAYAAIRGALERGGSLWRATRAVNGRLPYLDELAPIEITEGNMKRVECV